MWPGLCMDMHMDMCMGMCMDMHVGMCMELIGMCVDMCTGDMNMYAS